MRKFIPFVIVLAMASSGCAKKAVVKAPAKATLAQTQTEDDFASKSRNSAQEITYAKDPALQTVHFDYDKYALRPEARQTIEKNAAYTKKQRVPALRIEGHCDERGTVEYNLALGQRRANAVKEYYEQLGLLADMITAISYGKEKPLCQEHAESCWQLNRRAETLAGR